MWVLVILKNSDKSWFKACAMGVNKINSLMKTMAEKAGLDNSNLTNLMISARKRMIQTLNDKDITPSHIMQLSGDKIFRVLTTNLSHVSQEQQKSMSRILCGSTSLVQTETHSLVETAKQQSPTPTATRLFKSALFYGGQPIININSSFTEAHRQQTYKHIKRIFDSSDDDDSPPMT